MEKFCILANKEKDENLLVTQKVQACLSGYGKQVSVLVDDFSEEKGKCIVTSLQIMGYPPQGEFKMIY